MPSRYLVGIDLGTTNSVIAYIDTQDVGGVGSPIHVFPVPQLVRPGEVETLPVLPSFLYFPTEDELSIGGVSATWNEKPPMVTGLLAREQGALLPSRQVSSAKSWLSYPGVHRRAKILPAQAEPPLPMISPVEASARYLMHLRDAWNAAFGTDSETRIECQEIVLTVPGSFDEEARELTVEAARIAGLGNLTLLEEPLAAFYAWIATNRNVQVGTKDDVRDGDLILICDIGGGTTDFSLIRTREINRELQFERVAIGEHLLLGGDNFDFALARCAEEKLNNIKLTMRQRYALRRACCTAKERLLKDPALENVPVTILGSGHAVIGQALTIDLAREEVLQILTTGFLPITAPHEMSATGVQIGLREIGLPYSSDPAITKHLAAFLTQAVTAVNGAPANVRMARPDAVLFNGGFCAPAVVRNTIVDAISNWFSGVQSGSPRVLYNEGVDSAVARGAAYYGRVRRGFGSRIRGGNARTYYVGLPSDEGLKGICVLPAGVEEGTTLPLLNREFSLLANRPVSFTLYSSRTRHDAHGEVIVLDEANVHRHPPLVALLRYGKKMRDVHLFVNLKTIFTEVGTLELWCESRDTQHRWRLQFDLRGEEATVQQLDLVQAQHVMTGSPAVTTPDAGVESAAQLIADVFSDSGQVDPASSENLVSRMETALGAKRETWPISAVRWFGDVLIDFAAGRNKSPRHEARWLNLSGFCLRPGFGVLGDAGRVNKLRGIALSGLVFADDLQCQVGRAILLRRVAAGINASEQHGLYRQHTRARSKKSHMNRQLENEEWRLIASLEHLLASTRASLGHELVAKIKKDPEDPIQLWSLGRLGARIPLYGPLHCVVAADTAANWLNFLMGLSTFTPATGSAILLMERRTDGRSRDIDDAIREQAISRLRAEGIADEAIRLLSEYIPPESADAVRSFGESLPCGLDLVSSSNCLLSVPAFNSSPDFAEGVNR